MIVNSINSIVLANAGMKGEAVTVNVDRSITKVEEEDIGNIWFQQDDAT